MKSLFARFSWDERICLLYTLKCNFRCDHCLLGCHPGRSEKLGVDKAKLVLSKAWSHGKRYLNLSGGEVHLFYSEMLQVVHHAKQLGFEVDVETNGFWARSPDKRQKRIKEQKDAGVSSLFVSIDTYHTRYVSLDSLVALVNECHAQGMACEVTFVESPDSASDERILARLEHEQIPFYVEPPLPLGRAKALPPMKRNLLAGICDSLCMTITAKGDAFLCCGFGDDVSVLKSTPLYLSNIGTTPLDSIFEMSEFWGPRIAEFWSPGSPIAFSQWPIDDLERSGCCCDVCAQLLSTNEIVKTISDYTPEVSEDATANHL